MNNNVLTASRRLQHVQTPIIPEVAAWINSSPGTLSLGQGVVFYPPPEAALQRARQVGNDFAYHIYGDVTGIPELRTAITTRLEQENGIAISAERRIVVTAGSNMAFLNAILAITDPGDEVILLKPYYFNHEMAITMLGCNAVCVDCDDDYQPDLDAISAAIGKRTRAIVTVSPNNPTGAVYPEPVLTAINHLCREKGLFHISDEAYEYFTWDGDQHFSPASIPGAEQYTIALYSLSKAFGFASWRIGYMLIPAELESAVTKVQDTNLICATRVSQEAAVAALQTGRAYCDDQRQQIEIVRESMLAGFTSLADVCELPRTTGAFYFLAKLHTELTALSVVQRLIKEHGIAVIPGETFGLHNACYLRIAYGALTPDKARPAIDRLVNGIREIIT